MDLDPTSNPVSQLALVSFGSNLGNQSEIWQLTLAQFHQSPHFEVEKESSLLITRPIGGPKGQSDFLNAALVLKTDFSAEQIVKQLLQIEKNLGRLRLERWGPRTVDLDLLLLEDVISEADHCQVPHPRMTFRKFMMIPSAEVAADWVHPLCQKPLDKLLAQIDHPCRTVRCLLDDDLKTDSQRNLPAGLEIVKDLTLKNGLRFEVGSRSEFENNNLSDCNLTVFFGPTWKERFCKQSLDSGGLIPVGPYLWLCLEGEKEIEKEFSAALDAMKSL